MLCGMPDVFHASHRVNYADCTVGNHVYYARYLDILESARGQFFRHLGRSWLEWQEEGTLFPVIECRLCYKAPARYDDLLRLELRVTLATGIRLNFEYRVLKEDGAVLVEAETRHVCTGLNDKPKRLPAELLELLKPFMSPANAGAGEEAPGT
jgi:acyl-CoA thioester hydrolase